MNKEKNYKYYYIYLTKNLTNNKCYIGWHATNKLYDGYIGSGHLFKKAVKKYGKNNFVNGILEFCEYDEIFKKEKEWIYNLNTKAPIGYNLTMGGEGCIGYKHTPETMNKLIGRKISTESKKKMSLAKKGKKINYKKIISQDTKNKISMTLTNFEKRDQIIQLYENGKSVNDIKNILKCSTKTITKSIKNFNKRSWCFYNDNKLSEETKKKLSISHLKLGENKREVIRTLYLNGKTYKDIRNEVKCSPNTISSVIKKLK